MHGGADLGVIPARDEAARAVSGRPTSPSLVEALRYANDWTSRVDFSDLRTAQEQMVATNAFELPEAGTHLVLPSAALFGPALPPIDFSAVGHPAPPPSGVVGAYERKDGTPVRGYKRRPPRR